MDHECVTKTCRRCNETKAVTEFYGPQARTNFCKACIQRRARAYREKNLERARALNNANQKKYYRQNPGKHLKNIRKNKYWYQYGITVEQYDKILESQGGGCAVCGAKKNRDGSRLAVDHCHDTGVVRGILCSNCNRGIGMLGDNLAGLQAAVRYLTPKPDPEVVGGMGVNVGRQDSVRGPGVDQEIELL